MPEELGRDLEEIFQDDESEEDIKETLMFWKEVEGPFSNAIVFNHNNRFFVDEKDVVINGDEEAPFMMPDELFNILRILLKTTVMEFLTVLQIHSSEKAQLLNSNVLQEAGITYRMRKGWRLNKEKLNSFMKENPEILHW